MQDKIAQLEAQRAEKNALLGHRTYTEEVARAEKLKLCQEIIDINNEIAKVRQYTTPAPKVIEPEVVQQEANV